MMLVKPFLLGLFVSLALAKDFYEQLGVTKTASLKEIRKAFKEKALKHHPDKNTDDPDAHDKFLKISRVYEVLKDEQLRKVYDLHGEDGLDEKKSQGGYQSWSYYHDNFGIYDDDPEVITLNTADFEQSVTGSSDVWFINFYHPSCSHCHTLAPVWRLVARELAGVVRIGAVNCDDDYYLCRTQHIQSYPTLIAYPWKAKYDKGKEREPLMNYALGLVTTSATRLTPSQLAYWKKDREGADKPCLLLLHSDTYQTEELWATRVKLSAILDGLVTVVYLECEVDTDICHSLKADSGIQFFSALHQIGSEPGTVIEGWEPQDVAAQVMKMLPEIRTLDEEDYKSIRETLASPQAETSWLLQFSGQGDDDNFEIRKLPALLSSLHLGRVECSVMQRQCDELFIAKTPAFVLFKPGGGYEIHHGRLQAQDIALFAREANSAPRFRILTPNEFPRVLAEGGGVGESGSGGSTWFIDFYAPWCPPCMKLLPEFRKASRLIDTPVNFGSIDCTLHKDLCMRFNIRQYPTTVLYNQSVPHEYMGFHTASEIVDFVKDTLNPVVVKLDSTNFDQLVSNKPIGETWVVDYFANWCGPCREMASEYRSFARSMVGMEEVKVASIDCAEHGHICSRLGVRSYPSVMLYPADTHGTQRQFKFNGYSRDSASFRQWTYTYLPSSVFELDQDSFTRLLSARDAAWVVDFYAPWCQHCHIFAPEFEDTARIMKGKVWAGKVDCERHRGLCRRAGVRAYPSVHFYKPSSHPRQLSDGFPLSSLEKLDIIEKINGWMATANKQKENRKQKESKRATDEL